MSRFSGMWYGAKPGSISHMRHFAAGLVVTSLSCLIFLAALAAKAGAQTPQPSPQQQSPPIWDREGIPPGGQQASGNKAKSKNEAHKFCDRSHRLEGTHGRVRPSEQPLIAAIEKDDLDAVKALLAAGADVNAKDKRGWTPLMQAASDGETDIAEALLASGASVNAKTDDGRTALTLAVFGGCLDTIRGLLAAGADVNIKDCGGKTALMYAALEGKTEVVKALLESGADVNAKDIDGDTALTLATRANRTDVIQLLRVASAVKSH